MNSDRTRTSNSLGLAPDRTFVLYWMTAQRRLAWNHALDRAVAHAQDLNKPLLVLEPLRAAYPFASDRFHAFVSQGMADSAEAAKAAGVAYYPYIEPEPGEGKGLVAALAEHACVVVTDDYPLHFYPRMLEAAAAQVDVRMEAVDGNGLLPMRAADRVFKRAHDFRRFLQKTLAPYLAELPSADPLDAIADLPKAAVPRAITSRWPRASDALLRAERSALAALPIDHDVVPVTARGGSDAGTERLESFVADDLPIYDDQRRDVVNDRTSHLSPYLHFGHVGSHQVFAAVAEREDWTPDRIGTERGGARRGWWGMSEAAETFLDQLVTWRELGFNYAWQRDDYAEYDSLPEWARTTLADHSRDPREHIYDLETFERAATHDELWNAAQNQLVREGRIHNYLRMLWGKKILEWTATPQDAADVMVHLNDKYAVDGRDPNSYSGIFWTLGRYDRAWGPERKIFGKIRYMSSDNTRRKLDVKPYIERFADASA